MAFLHFEVSSRGGATRRQRAGNRRTHESIDLGLARARRLVLFQHRALPYVNAPPHLAHALELVIGDALARHRRQRGADVFFTGGTDDHARKNVRAARALGLDPRRLVETNGAVFRRLATAVGASFDDYLHTSSDPRHVPSVIELWRRCAESGDIYAGDYSGRYCTGCEAFLSEADREDAASLAAGRAEDFGIGVPGDPSQVVYVWFDALANYLSQLGSPERTENLERYWLDASSREHLIGKDILRFHAVYWPAICSRRGCRSRRGAEPTVT